MRFYSPDSASSPFSFSFDPSSSSKSSSAATGATPRRRPAEVLGPTPGPSSRRRQPLPRGMGYLVFPPPSASASSSLSAPSPLPSCAPTTPQPQPPAEPEHTPLNNADAQAREAEARRGEEAWVASGGMLRDAQGRRDVARTEAVRAELRLREWEAEVIRRWERYEAGWRKLLGSGAKEIGIGDIPWPGGELGDLTVERVEEFLLEGLGVRGCVVTRRERVRSSFLRWHPDKMTGVLARVVEEDVESVTEGIRLVIETSFGAQINKTPLPAPASPAPRPDSGQRMDADVSPRTCSVRGCSQPLLPESTNKMCEACRGRHRVYASTKRARRKLEKAAVVGMRRIDDQLKPVPSAQNWPPPATTPPAAPAWDDTAIDPRLFAETAASGAVAVSMHLAFPPYALCSSSELAGALTLPTPSDTQCQGVKGHEVARALIGDAEPHRPDPDLNPGTRPCSVKGCKALIESSYTFKMCPLCRTRYRIYGTTKRAKWKAEREAFDRELAGLRTKEDERRRVAGERPLSESPDELRHWELSIIDEEVALPFASSDTLADNDTTNKIDTNTSGSAVDNVNAVPMMQATLRPNATAGSSSSTVQNTDTDIEAAPAPAHGLTLEKAAHAPLPPSARMCTVSHCHKILPGLYRYKRCEQHRLQNRYHSQLKRVREKGLDGAGGADAGADGGDEKVSTEKQEQNGGASGSGSGERMEEDEDGDGSKTEQEGQRSFDNGAGKEDKPQRKRAVSSCATPACQNLLMPRVRWRHCDICRARERVFQREMGAADGVGGINGERGGSVPGGVDVGIGAEMGTEIGIIGVSENGERNGKGNGEEGAGAGVAPTSLSVVSGQESSTSETTPPATLDTATKGMGTSEPAPTTTFSPLTTATSTTTSTEPAAASYPLASYPHTFQSVFRATPAPILREVEHRPLPTPKVKVPQLTIREYKPKEVVLTSTPRVGGVGGDAARAFRELVQRDQRTSSGMVGPSLYHIYKTTPSPVPPPVPTPVSGTTQTAIPTPVTTYVAPGIRASVLNEPPAKRSKSLSQRPGTGGVAATAPQAGKEILAVQEGTAALVAAVSLAPSRAAPPAGPVPTLPAPSPSPAPAAVIPRQRKPRASRAKPQPPPPAPTVHGQAYTYGPAGQYGQYPYPYYIPPYTYSMPPASSAPSSSASRLAAAPYLPYPYHPYSTPPPGYAYLPPPIQPGQYLYTPHGHGHQPYAPYQYPYAGTSAHPQAHAHAYTQAYHQTHAHPRVETSSYHQARLPSADVQAEAEGAERMEMKKRKREEKEVVEHPPPLPLPPVVMEPHLLYPANAIANVNIDAPVSAPEPPGDCPAAAAVSVKPISVELDSGAPLAGAATSAQPAAQSGEGQARACAKKTCRRTIAAGASGTLCERCRARMKRHQAKARQRFKLEPRKSVLMAREGSAASGSRPELSAGAVKAGVVEKLHQEEDEEVEEEEEEEEEMAMQIVASASGIVGTSAIETVGTA
ncbi:hypothetical protein D9615_004919 [Tricholomella constricta]|uniref:Uncharacterized protein n=1 Tax=Tricholomella constricta TaxID=117010 RepID=A0A8H5HHW9_9AGAR|nr:hypothetical protein D9615_004919 [Tricholomella constricta]